MATTRRRKWKPPESGRATTQSCAGPQQRSRQLAARGGPEARENSQYAIPLAFRKRTLFKMDFAEVVYISELRTRTCGALLLSQCGLCDV